MPNFKTILVPVDFSPSAEVAGERAEELAKAAGAELVYLHVVDLTPMLLAGGAGYVPTDAFVELEQRAREKLDATVLRTTRAGIAARALLLHGAAAQVIVDVADREQVSLIVMGTHGRSGVQRWVLGSVAERVARTSHVPVLSVRDARSGADAGETRAESV